MHNRARCFALVAGAFAFASPPHESGAQGASVQPLRFGSSPGQYADYEITRDTTIAHTGRVSVRVRAGEDAAGFGNVSAVFPALAYVGHRVRFSVFLRAASLNGQGAQLWARADDANHRSVAFFNSGATLFRGTTDWTQLSISLDIPASAAQVYVGALSHGAGSLWIDDAHLESDGGTAPLDVGFEDPADFVAPPPRAPVPVVREKARALSTSGFANVSAFTSALGYVRFFHPSPEALRVNWDAFAVHGMRAVEGATTPDSLASTLRTLFAPIAPGVTFARAGAKTPTIAKPPNATHAVFWLHWGVGSPSGGAARERTKCLSQRTDRRRPRECRSAASDVDVRRPAARFASARSRSSTPRFRHARRRRVDESSGRVVHGGHCHRRLASQVASRGRHRAFHRDRSRDASRLRRTRVVVARAFLSVLRRRAHQLAGGTRCRAPCRGD